jgi:hypothetical protein
MNYSRKRVFHKSEGIVQVIIYVTKFVRSIMLEENWRLHKHTCYLRSVTTSHTYIVQVLNSPHVSVSLDVQTHCLYFIFLFCT